MATKVFDFDYLELLDGSVIEATPLKIKYLREFMDAFDLVKYAVDDEQAILLLTNCARIAMKQYKPEVKTAEELEDLVNLPMIYRIIDIAGGVRVSEDSTESVKAQAEESQKDAGWASLDLAKLETEVFLLGIWKNYQELEESMSMAELVSTIGSRRELDYNEKKFLAGIQGIDLEKDTNKSNAWEDMKARVFSGGKAKNANDIVALQGVNAVKAGFGIGMGLDYVDMG
jgi:hypothetical protein